MNRKISGHAVRFVGASVVGLVLAGEALADQENRADQLQEIVVTAQKRASTVQDTPISITALTGQDLEDRGITDITSVVQSVPGVSMRTSGPGQTELEIRGMTSSGGNSSTVGFYLDDTPLTAPASAQNGKVVIDPNLYDLNRIEVLRGPQGTLYGSGSMGGTIKLVPNAPNPNAFDASAQVILGGTDGGDSLNHTESAMVNLPLGSDTLALRLVGTLEHLSGWIDRIVIAQPDFPAPINATTRGNVAAAPIEANYHDVNDENLRTVRASLLWKATDRLSIEPTFMYQEITQGGLNLIDSQPGTDTQYQPYNSPEPFEDRIDIASLNVQYHFDIADLTSTTSYWNRDENLRQDGTEEIAAAVGLPIYPSEGGPGQNFPTSLEDDRSKQYSEEIRLTSAGNTQFKWLVGYFYQDFESDWNLFVDTPFTGVTAFPTVPNAFTQYQPTKILQNSFFGEASYTFLQDFTATAGLRRYYYHSSVNTAVSGWLSSSGGNAYDYYSTGERDSGVTPKFNLSYQLDKDLLVYGTVSQGFRPGGGNQPIPTTGSLGTTCLANLGAIGLTSAPLGFKPDKVWSYEIGEKFRDSEGRVTINSAGYFENWQHIQQNIPLGCGFPFTSNAGDAHIYGAELEINAILVPGLVASLNGSWLHAEYIANAAPSTTIDERVQDVPEITASASLAYRHGITDSLALIGRIDNNYVGSRIDTTAQANYLPSYDLTNIRAGVEGNRWTAVLFVNNVTNRLALLTNSPAINVNIPTFNRTAMEQPLTFGIDLSYRMGR
jgi:iron complex outermembrane recepter protein